MRPRGRHLVAAAGVVAALLVPAGARAAATDVSNAGIFELDGNIAHNSATTPPFDWADLFDAGGMPNPVGTPLVSSAFQADYSTPDPTYYASGSTDTLDISSWSCTSKNNPQDLTDILNTYAAVFQPTSGPAAGHVLLYLGLERFSPNGDANVAFWLLHNHTACVGGRFIGTHQPGDLLVEANFTNGGTAVDVTLLAWNPAKSPPFDTLASGADCSSQPATTPFCGIANSATITPPWPTGVSALQPNTFFEAGIDLTTAVPGANLCTVDFLAQTRSSPSITAALDDYAGTDLAMCRATAITTQPSESEIVIGGSVTDQASLTGGTPSAGGTVTYRVFAGTVCSGTPVFTSGPLPVVDGGAPPSAPFTPSAPGMYEWQASYGGDQLNQPATSVCGAEPLNVTKAQPSISTVPSATQVAAGTAVTDTAKVTGGFNPTGTVTFQLFGPSAPSCTGAPEASFPNVPMVNGSATSPPFTVTAVGTHRWVATYNGDANNLPIASNCNEETVSVVAILPTVTTHPMPQEAPVGTAISDSATVAAAPLLATGTVTFDLFGPADPTCAEEPLATFGPITLINGSATSGTHTVTQVGTYHWIAHYSGDDNHSPASSLCQDEPVTIHAATPGISTTPSATEVVAGTAVTDTATVTGGFNPTGTVTFQLFGPTSPTCAGAPEASFPNVPLVNRSATSPPFTVTGVGTHRWVATYNRDANNVSVASKCSDEAVTVLAILPKVTTDPRPQEATVGTPIADSATVTSAPFPPTGTVTFDLFGPAAPTCGGTPLATFGPITVTNGSATSGTHTVTQVGTYHWIAHYSGDSNHSPASSLCQDEPVTIHAATPGISTAPSAIEVVAGTAVTDTATVTGGFNPTGTVSFELFGPTAPRCTGTPEASFTNVALVNGSATSPPFTVTVVGTHRWVATYNGDANNNSIGSNCSDEAVDVRPIPSVIVTDPRPVEAPVGSAIADHAIVTSRSPLPATGRVTFELFGPASPTCAPPALATLGPVALDANSEATSPAHIVTQAGTYHWIVQYSGDSNHSAASSLCRDETVTIDPATPGISTDPKPQSAAVGEPITDGATLSGAFSPTGTVSFDIFGPSDPSCTGDPLATLGPVTVSNAGATSPPFTPTVAGTYHWIGRYSGDQNNTGVSDVCADEPVIVARATPAIATTPSPNGPPGTPISDTATVTGGFHPSGSVTFLLFGSRDTECVEPPLATFASVPLAGGVASSPSFTATQAAAYHWIATYSGDAANAPVTSACQTEQVVIDPPVPSIATSVPASGTVGTPLHDTATVSGGASPSGTVTFQVFGPADPTCSGVQQVANFANVPLTGGTAISPAFTPALAGVHHWLVEYNGDSANASTISQCADEAVDVASSIGVTAPSTGAGPWRIAAGMLLLLSGTAVVALAGPRRFVKLAIRWPLRGG